MEQGNTMTTQTKRQCGFFDIAYPSHKDAYNAGYRAGLEKAKRAAEAKARTSAKRLHALQQLSAGVIGFTAAFSVAFGIAAAVVGTL